MKNEVQAGGREIASLRAARHIYNDLYFNPDYMLVLTVCDRLGGDRRQFRADQEPAGPLGRDYQLCTGVDARVGSAAAMAGMGAEGRIAAD
jgi:hypothetical protein